MHPSFHLGRCRPLLKLQLSRVHHGSEGERHPSPASHSPAQAVLWHAFSWSSWDEGHWFLQLWPERSLLISQEPGGV